MLKASLRTCMAGRWELTDEQWKLVEPILRPARREDNRGRPWHDTRAVLNGVLWILGSGAQWAEMPAKYPPYQTSHRRFQQWIREGKLVEALRLLAKQLHERGKPTRIVLGARDLGECCLVCRTRMRKAHGS